MAAAEFDDPGTGRPKAAIPGGFRAEVTRQLGTLGIAVAGWQGDGVSVVTPGGAKHTVWLSNLHRRAKAADRAEWPGMIREFLERTLAWPQGNSIPDDLTTAADRLRPRLGRPFGKDLPTRPWSAPLTGTGLEVTLVIDFPTTMAYVTHDMLAKTGKCGEELMEVALANLRDNTPDDYLTRVSEELDISIGHCGDGYDAARALLVEELMPECHAGFWVAVPSREELVVRPVSLAALPTIHVVKLFAEDSHRKHAYPITDEVFWVRGGEWYRFGVRLTQTELVIDAPEPFAEVLADLRAEGDAASGEADNS